jgi:hypothetical protein
MPSYGHILGFMPVLGASHLSQVLSPFIEIGSRFIPKLAWRSRLPHVAEMTDLHHCTQPLIEMGA